MKRRLEESIDLKRLKIESMRKQKIGPQTMKWLKENPGFELAVAAKLTVQQIRDIKHRPKLSQ